MKQGLQVDLGLVAYAEAYALQRRIVAARKADAIEDVFLLCEHPHVLTQGRNGRREHLLVSEHVLRQKGVEFHESSRGGDITYHGPGQIVGYPIFNLGAIRRDVVWYVRMLEETMIRTTAEFGIAAKRVLGKTGIWVDSGSTEEKLGAIGVHLSRWVTSHGFAYNVSTDLRFFNLLRAREKRLDRSDDSQYRSASGQGRAAARHFHAAHGEIRFADQGQGRHKPFRRPGQPAHRFAHFHARRFDSGDGRRGYRGALPRTKDCSHDLDWRRRQLDRRVSRRAELRGRAKGGFRLDS